MFPKMTFTAWPDKLGTTARVGGLEVDVTPNPGGGHAHRYLAVCRPHSGRPEAVATATAAIPEYAVQLVYEALNGRGN